MQVPKRARLSPLRTPFFAMRRRARRVQPVRVCVVWWWWWRCGGRRRRQAGKGKGEGGCWRPRGRNPAKRRGIARACKRAGSAFSPHPLCGTPGPLKDNPAEQRVGVELDEPVGKNHGKFKGDRYFKCVQKSPGGKFGVLVAPKKVRVACHATRRARGGEGTHSGWPKGCARRRTRCMSTLGAGAVFAAPALPRR